MRITGGIHRSRTLVAPRGDATRPTSDRVREALFAILVGERPLDGARVLDLYAGTGALAFEALSRGGARATLVERARPALEAIRTNIDALHLQGETLVIAAPVERAGRAVANAGPFDLVFADPPYALIGTGEAPRVIASLVALGVLAEGARVVIEHAKTDEAPTLGALTLRETRRYGDSVISFYLSSSAR